MLGDIAIMVFALIAIFTGKKWAIVTATIWFIVAVVLGFAGIVEPSVTNSNSAIPSETLNDITFTDEEKSELILGFFEILFIIIGWIRVIFTKKKQIPQA